MSSATPAFHAVPHPERVAVRSALRRAWWLWLGLMSVPFLVFLYVAWSLQNGTKPRNMDLANPWFIGTMAYMIVALPAAFFWRSNIFKAYWRGKPVAPHDYLSGVLTVWVALVIGGVLALLGCYFSRAFMPCMIPAVVAFLLFVPMWPSGRAMYDPVGDQEDTETYEEPR